MWVVKRKENESIWVVDTVGARKIITANLVAQVIGYYSAFKIGTPQTIVMIMTASVLKLVFFPFYQDGKQFINAVELEEFYPV